MRVDRSCLFVLVVAACGGGEVGNGGDGGGGGDGGAGSADGTPDTSPADASGPVRLTHGDPANTGPGENFPDPGLLLAGGRFYRFATNGGGGHVPVAGADDSAGPWDDLGDAMPSPPAWVIAHIWAPEVHRFGDRYYLYYAATVANDGSAFGEHAIGVAESDTPDGPFTPVGEAPLHRDPEGRGVIDPDVVEIAGTAYLVYSTDWGPGGRASGTLRTLQARTLTTPTTLADDPVTLLEARAGGWEAGTVEAPALVPGPDGRLHLLYAGGNFESAYATGYALCPPTPGACERTSDEPWLAASPPNPGGLDVAIAADGAPLGLHHAGPVSLREPYVLPLAWTPE